MFHWICPECGREIAPTVRECPVCDSGAEQEELVLAGVVEASARTLQMEASSRETTRGIKGDRTDLAVRRADVDGPGRTVSPALPELAKLPGPLKLPEPVKWNRATDPAKVQETSAPTPAEEPVVEKPLAEALARPATAEAAALTPEILDAKSAFDRASEEKAASLRGILNRAADAWVNQPGTDAKPVVTRTVESRAVDVHGLDTHSIETRSIDTRPVEAKPVDSKQAQPKQAESKPVETKSLEGHLADKQIASSAEAGESDPRDAQPSEPVFDRIPLLAKLSRLALPKIVPVLAKNEFAKSETGSRESGQTDAGVADPGQPAGAPIDTVAAALPEAVLPSTPASVPQIAPASEVRTEAPPMAAALGGPEAKVLVTPQAARYEPMLPTFSTPERESLNALLDAVSMLDDDARAQVDPPAAGKLPLPFSPAQLPPVSPALVSIGAVEPRTIPATTRPATAMVHNAASDERKIAGLALLASCLPLRPPDAQTLNFASAVEPSAVEPSAGALRAPRSPAPFRAPKAAGLVKYAPLEKHPIRPFAPPADLRRSATAPRVTLPGPMLTRPLVSFTGRELAPIFLEARAFRKRFRYGWIATVLAVGTVFGVGFSSLVSPAGRPPVEARAASTAADESSAAETVRVASNPAESNSTAAAAAVPDASAPPAASNALSKSIEVTGFRIVLDPSRKPQVEYLVVNHSSARFPDATIYVTLRGANARLGQAPLCRFSFAAPDLGPYEAKEMISAIEKTNRPVNLPEWQDLHAEIEIGR